LSCKWLRESLCESQEIEVMALCILIEESPFSLVITVWLPKFKVQFTASPRILGFLKLGMIMLLKTRFSVMICVLGMCF
jgi:hypothetical protein